MGCGSGFKCKNCGKETTYLEGVGMIYPSVLDDFIEAALSGKYGKLMQEYAGRSEIQKIRHTRELFDYVTGEHQIYVCPNCHRGFNFEDFGLKIDGKWYKVQYKCRKCGVDLHVRHEGEDFCCPKCGGEFEKDNVRIIMWDQKACIEQLCKELDLNQIFEMRKNLYVPNLSQACVG